MSERTPGSAPAAPRSGPRTGLRAVRMLSTGRWRPPLGQPPLAGRRAARVIVVGAAVPGVGKSVVASNLAVALAGLGRHVVLFDLDLATPRQHALFGVAAPEGGDRPTGIRNLRLSPPAAEVQAPPDLDRRRAVLDGLGEVEADVVIVDVASGRRDDLWAGFSGAERLLVTTGDGAAFQQTYEFLREAALRAEHRHGPNARAELARFAGGLIGNGAGTPEDAERFHAFARLVREELGIPLTSLGCLRKSRRIAQSVMMGRPLLARRGIDDEVRLFHQVAELMAVEQSADRGCALDGPTPAMPPSRPIDVDRYQRRHPRFVVDWAATLVTDQGPNAVRVRDLSESGAAIETTLKLGVGDQGVLCLYQLDGQPSIQVVVRNVVPGLSRVGLAFAESGETVVRVAAAARSRASAP